MYRTSTTVYVTQSDFQKYEKLKKPKELVRIKKMELHQGVK